MIVKLLRNISLILIPVILFCSFASSNSKSFSEEDFWKGIPRSLHDRFTLALSNSTEDWVPAFADSLEQISSEKGKAPFRFYAEQIRSYMGFMQLDSALFFTSNEKAKSIALDLGIESDYYLLLLNESSFHLSSGHYLKAVKSAEDLIQQASMSREPENAYYGFFTLGEIYSQTYDFHKALDNYKKALDTFGPDEEHSPARAQVLFLISSVYYELQDFDNAIAFANQSIESSPTEPCANAIIALASFRKDDYPSFRKNLALFNGNPMPDPFYEFYKYRLRIAENLLRKDYQTALSQSDTLIRRYDAQNVKVEVLKRMGRWEDAFNLEHKYVAIRDSIKQSLFDNEILSLDYQQAEFFLQKEREKDHIKLTYMGVIFVLVLLIVLLVIGFEVTRSRLIIKTQKEQLAISNRYRLLVDNGPFGFNRAKLIRDAEGNIVDYVTLEVNKTLSESLSSHNIKVGEKTICQSYPKSGHYIVEKISDALKQNLPYVRFHYHMEEYDLYYEIIIVFDETDTIQIFSLNSTEVTKARMKLNAAYKDLSVAKTKAEQADRAKTYFIQNMSHEIRTPLNAIMGFSQLLSLPDGFNTEQEKAQYADYINQSSNMLTMLIDDILDISDAENGNYRVELSDSSCNLMCRVAMKNVEYRTPPGVRMYFTSEVNDDYRIHTDPRRVQQVIINYLTNACKHTERGEIHVHCSVTENPGKVTFSVTDTGRGVPEDMAENIFERFTKLNAFVQGTGLGLNICKIVAEKLGGEVLLDTSYKSGARFLFIL